MAKLPNFCPIVRASRLEKAFVLSSFDNKLPAEAFDDARVTCHNGAKNCIKSPFKFSFAYNLMRNFPRFQSLVDKNYHVKLWALKPNFSWLVTVTELIFVVLDKLFIGRTTIKKCQENVLNRIDLGFIKCIINFTINLTPLYLHK